MPKCPRCKRNFKEPSNEMSEHGCSCGYVKEDYVCEECGISMPYYIPEICCDGKDCGCMGLPLEPCVCDECYDAKLLDFRKEED